MKIERLSLHQTETGTNQPIAACIGYFDGLHKGHQALLHKTVEEAKKLQAVPALITFDPDPWVVVKGLQEVSHLTSLNERFHLAQKWGIEQIYILDFTPEMAALSPTAFMDFILSHVNLKVLVCGFDFHYGQKGEGNTETLQSSRYQLYVVEAVCDEKGKISSTRIVEALSQGKIEEVNTMLGYPYSVSGIITKGFGNGKRIGFPTANIQWNQEAILPSRGVYAGFVYILGSWHKAMINIGNNPTFGLTDNVTMEAHILDFKEDVYEEQAKVEFLYFLRPETKFASIEDLQKQLQQDVEETRQRLGNHEA